MLGTTKNAVQKRKKGGKASTSLTILLIKTELFSIQTKYSLSGRVVRAMGPTVQIHDWEKQISYSQKKFESKLKTPEAVYCLRCCCTSCAIFQIKFFAGTYH